MPIKSFSLQPHETQLQEILNSEQQQTAARIGSLMLDLEEARKALAGAQERQRSLMFGVMLRNNVRGARGARIDGNNLVCDIDEPPAAPAPQRVNGGTTDESQWQGDVSPQ